MSATATVAVSGGGGASNIVLLLKSTPLKRQFQHNSLSTTTTRRRIKTSAVVVVKYGRFDPNAEQAEDVGGGKRSRSRSRSRSRRRRTWWSENENVEFYEQDHQDDDNEFLDVFWIFQVFKSYGWALPPILLSLLLCNGPKAFLVTLAIPLGHSTVTFVFRKLFGATENRPRSRTKRSWKPRYTNSATNTTATTSGSNAATGDESREPEGETVGGYQSWVGSNGSSGYKDSSDLPQFGGWDEFLGGTTPPRTGTNSPPPPKRRTVANGKLGSRGRKSDVPLLLRLLIAVFPFLGSWTKIL